MSVSSPERAVRPSVFVIELILVALLTTFLIATANTKEERCGVLLQRYEAGSAQGGDVVDAVIARIDAQDAGCGWVESEQFVPRSDGSEP